MKHPVIILGICLFIFISFYRDALSKSNDHVTRISALPSNTSCSCSKDPRYFSDNLRANSTIATTCQDSLWRGHGQKVVAFSFYGNPNSSHHKKKQYREGIEENLLDLPIYFPGWIMRLYHDLALDDPMYIQLCTLYCSHTHLDLCKVQDISMETLTNPERIFPMNWKFFPTLDEQVQ